MLRNALLYLSSQPQVFNFVRHNRMAKGFASRFVAGETLDTGLEAVRQLNSRGITATLDLLGESVRNESEARASARVYIEMLDRIHAAKLNANASIKLTAMGLDISEDLCVANMQEILDRAREQSSFIRLDMESSEYTQKTLDLFYERLYPSYRGNVGIVLQSCGFDRHLTARELVRTNRVVGGEDDGVDLHKGTRGDPDLCELPRVSRRSS